MYIWRKYFLFLNDFEIENVVKKVIKVRLIFVWFLFVVLELEYYFEEVNFDWDIFFFK